MATHSSILAWRLPWTEEPGRLYGPRGHKESDTTERLTLLLYVASPDGKYITGRLGKLVESVTVAGKVNLEAKPLC